MRTCVACSRVFFNFSPGECHSFHKMWAKYVTCSWESHTVACQNFKSKAKRSLDDEEVRRICHRDWAAKSRQNLYYMNSSYFHSCNMCPFYFSWMCLLCFLLTAHVYSVCFLLKSRNSPISLIICMHSEKVKIYVFTLDPEYLWLIIIFIYSFLGTFSSNAIISYFCISTDYITIKHHAPFLVFSKCNSSLWV